MEDAHEIELQENPVAAPTQTLFGEGFATPWMRRNQQRGVPWDQVQEVLCMARSALIAKQQAAEALLKEIEQMRKSAMKDKLLERAQRAEVDSGLLVDELQALIRAKSDAAQERADLDRANALLMAERELLCEQLDVSPDNVNLCQAVQKVLAAARRTRGLEAQLRLLARQQRDTLLQLEAAREAEARAGRHWQACEQVYLQCLAAHGITAPKLPPAPAQRSINASAAELQCSSSAASSCGGSSSSAAAYTQLLQRLGSGGAAGHNTGSLEGIVGSPGSHLLPPTPPASDLNASVTPLHIRRSHSLDSGLNSLTGLLDQLALGQLGSDEGCEYEFDEYDSQGWLDTLSDEGKGPNNSSSGAVAHPLGDQAGASSSAAATAAAALLLLGGCPSGHTLQQLEQHKGLLHAAHQQQQHLQTVQEGCEEQ